MTMDIAYDTTALLGGFPPYHHKKPMTTARNADATFPSLACDPPMTGGANSSDTSDCPCMYDDGKNNEKTMGGINDGLMNTLLCYMHDFLLHGSFYFSTPRCGTSDSESE